jgi:hypothetical protein
MTEALEVSTALYGVDVIYVGVDVFVVACVVHDGYFDGHALLLGVDVDYVVEKVYAARDLCSARTLSIRLSHGKLPV